jgi:hypothetical protein
MPHPVYLTHITPYLRTYINTCRNTYCHDLEVERVTYKTGFGLDGWIYCTLYTQLWTTSNTALSLIYTIYSSPLHTHWGSQSSLVVSWQRMSHSLLSHQTTHEVICSPPKSFLAIILHRSSSYPSRLAFQNSTLHFQLLLYSLSQL